MKVLLKKLLTSKNKEVAKRVLSGSLSFILVFTLVMNYIAPVITISAQDDYYEVGYLSFYKVMPKTLSEDSSKYSLFDNESRYYYTGKDEMIMSSFRKPGKVSIGARQFRTRASVIGNVMTGNNPRAVIPDLLGSSDLDRYVENQLKSKIIYYNEVNESIHRRYEGYYVRTDDAGTVDTGWQKFGTNKVIISANYDTYDIMMLAMDDNAPKANNYTMNIYNEVPYMWLTFGERLRVCADNTVNKDVLANMKLKITLVDRLNQTDTPVIVTAKATELVKGSDTENAKIGFEINNEEISEKLLSDVDASQIIGYDGLLNKEWRILYIEDISDYKEYPLTTTAGDLGTKVTLPVTDIAGNQVEFVKKYDARYRTLEFDAVKPEVEKAQMRGSTINKEITTVDLEDDESWPADIERAELFSGVGDTVGADLILSERVTLKSGTNKNDVKLKWSIKDKDGNNVTTSLKSIENTTTSVNSGTVSKLVFEDITITDDMLGNGEQIKPIGIVNYENICDFTNNIMSADFKPAISHQTFMDIKGPTADFTGDVFKVADSNYIRDKEVYYIIGVNISDSKVTSGTDTVTTVYGSGVNANIENFVSLTSHDGAPSVTYQYSMSTKADYISGDLENKGTIGIDENYSKFNVPSEGDFYMHLKLTIQDGMEFDETKGVTINFKLKDAKGNESNISKAVTKLGLDNLEPKLDLQIKDITKLTVSAKATDMNELNRIEYQWVEDGSATGWTMVNLSDSNVNTHSLDIAYSETIPEVFNQQLYVRVYDFNENVVEKYINVVADFQRRIPRYTFNSDREVPNSSHSITLLAPITSITGEKGGYVRAILTTKNATYVRACQISDDSGIELFDFSADNWYQVEITDGKYTSVTSVEKPDMSDYGYISVEFSASSVDLTPVADKAVYDEQDAHLSTSETYTIANAPKRNDVHNIEITSVKDINQTAMTAQNNDTYSFYKVMGELTGISYEFTIDNALVSEWNRMDVDWDNSYAVLIKTDENGDTSTAAEVTDRFKLSNSKTQTITLSEKDKTGIRFQSGVYVIKIHIAQKAGGYQELIPSEKIILDNNDIPERVGIREYSTAINGTFSADDYLLTTTAEENEVLTTINIAVGEPDNHGDDRYNNTGENVVVKDDNDNPIYELEHQNALLEGYGYYPDEMELDIVADVVTQTFLGETVGKVKGIRYWNKASAGDYTSVEYTTATFNSETSTANVTISAQLAQYGSEQSDIVTSEVLKTTDVSDFKLAIGNNTIQYQLIMESGKETPVYSFDLNLYDHEVDMVLEYEFGPSIDSEVAEHVYDEDGEYVFDEDGNYVYNMIHKTKSQYVDVYVKEAYSPVGGLELYHVSYNDYNNSWNYELIEDTTQPIRLTMSCNGYGGNASTRTDITGEPGCNEFLILVDATGSAVTAYPILPNNENTAENEYPYGIDSNIGTMTVKHCDASITTVGSIYGISTQNDGVSHKFVFNAENGASLDSVIDEFTIQVDDREPETVSAGYSEENDFIDGVNNAGIVDYSTGYYGIGSQSYRDMISIVFPYDSTVTAGTNVNHTVKIVGYLDEQEVYNESFTVSAENIKPELNIYASAYMGENTVYANTYMCKDPTDLYNNFYSDSVRFPFYKNGAHTVGAYDKYGNYYESEINITGIADDPVMTISETEPTTEPVTVTVKSESGILSMSYTEILVDGEPVNVINIPEGWTVEGIDTSELTITATSNNENDFCYVYCTYEDGSTENLSFEINNIYPSEIKPKVEWQYNEYLVNDNTYEGEITAKLIDENGTSLIDPNTGETPEYKFVPGGVTEYTFSGYTNEMGLKGADIVAKLPFELKTVEAPTTNDDKYTPDIGITGFATYDGKVQPIEAAYTQTDATRPEEAYIELPDYSLDYGAENVFTDIEFLLRKIGWADSYVLNIDAYDENAVKLYITKDEYAKVPAYDGGTSDTIDGVKLIGRTLQIEKNVNFALHAVDEKGNITSIHFEVNTLGETAPEPNIAQVLTKEGNKVRIYMLPPNIEGVTDCKITNTGAQVETDTDSVFHGYYYMEYDDNKDVNIDYSYSFKNNTYKGTIITQVVKIDKTAPIADTTKWSANYDANGIKKTNQDITVQMDFNRALSDVYVVDSEGNRILTPDGVTIANMEDRVTIIYENNAPEINLKVVSAINNVMNNTISIGEIKTIDKEKAIISTNIKYSENHRKAVVTFTANEDVIHQNSSKTGTEFSETIEKNGNTTYKFSDLAGNITEVDVNITDLIEEELSLVLSTNANESGIINPEEYDVDIGDILYAKVNRDSKLYINGIEKKDITANTWNAITIEEDLEGFYPIIKANDEYGNAAVVQLLRIPVKDRVAPAVIIKKNMVSVSSDNTEAQINEILSNNIMVSDNVTSYDKLTIVYDYTLGVQSGKYQVTYKVSDEEGNQTVKTCWIRLYVGEEMAIKVNGALVERNETLIVSKGEQSINISFSGEPYKVTYRPGIKTVGQMKNGATTLTNGYVELKDNNLSLDLNKTGYYTILITTQSNDTYSFVLYVEQ